MEQVAAPDMRRRHAFCEAQNARLRRMPVSSALAVMVSEVESLPALALQLGERRRIGVDGTDGVRKTSASAALAETLGMPLISLDDYLIKNQGGYVQFLRYEDLDRTFRQSDRFVVEGVCLLQVLERAGVSVDALVYVKRYRHNLWAD